jgi:hypothetical protein
MAGHKVLYTDIMQGVWGVNRFPKPAPISAPRKGGKKIRLIKVSKTRAFKMCFDRK